MKLQYFTQYSLIISGQYILSHLKAESFGEHFHFKMCLRKTGTPLQSLINIQERRLGLLKSVSREEEYTSSVTYFEPCQTFKIECFVTMIHGFKTLSSF